MLKLEILLRYFVNRAPGWQAEGAICSANVAFSHALFNGSLGDQSQNIRDRSSPNFQDRYVYGWA